MILIEITYDDYWDFFGNDCRVDTDSWKTMPSVVLELREAFAIKKCMEYLSIPFPFLRSAQTVSESTVNTSGDVCEQHVSSYETGQASPSDQSQSMYFQNTFVF